MSSPEIPIQFGGQQLLLHAHGVLYWPDQKTLIASDLHFEKSTFLGQHGAFIPPYDTQDTLERLEHLIAHYQPERLILLGDSFHDMHAWNRLNAALRTRIMALTHAVAECIWIEGNHDAALHTHPLGVMQEHIQIGSLHFAHDDHVAERPLIIGHYHPKARVQLAQRSVTGKCFIHSDTLLIMPSFGSYTGGLNIGDPAIQNAFHEQSTAIHLLYNKSLYPLPPTSLLR